MIKNRNLLKSKDKIQNNVVYTQRRSHGGLGTLPLPQAPPRKTPKSAKIKASVRYKQKELNSLQLIMIKYDPKIT